MTPNQEEHLGKLMLRAARKEGHRKGLPKPPAPPANAGQFDSPLAKDVLNYLNGKSFMPSSQIANGIGHNKDSVRSSLSRLQKAGLVTMQKFEGIMNFRLSHNNPLVLGQDDKTRTTEERASVTE